MEARRRQSLASWVQSYAQTVGSPPIGWHLPTLGARVGQRVTNLWCTRLTHASAGPTISAVQVVSVAPNAGAGLEHLHNSAVNGAAKWASDAVQPGVAGRRS